jgi:hypothetical protein
MASGLTYKGAAELLGSRDSRKLANNTYLERRFGGAAIAIRYHDTDVVTLTPRSIVLDSGGWHTKTTWERMSYSAANVAAGHNGVVVFLADEGWETGGHPYFDGIRLNANGTKLTREQPNAPRGLLRPIRTVSGFNGMTRQESNSLRGETQLLQPVRESEGSKVFEMPQAMIQACPHYIFAPEHYRADGTCRCNDPSHREMSEWGYTWNGSIWNGDEA